MNEHAKVDYSQETVALCLPVYDQVHHRSWKADMLLSMELGRLFPPENIAVWVCHKLPQPHAQNYLVQSVLSNTPAYGVVGNPLRAKSRPDWMLWVEDDSTPPADSFQLLRQFADPVGKPVVHGISFDRAGSNAPSIWRVKSDGSGMIEPIWDWQDNTLYRVAHSGTCIALFHTSLWERMKRPWFRMQPFEPGCQGMIPCISLSQRMHEANIPIYAYTGCVAGHMSEAVEVNAEISRKNNPAVAEAMAGLPVQSVKLRQYPSDDAYREHQKAKTLTVKDGTCTELRPFEQRKEQLKADMGLTPIPWEGRAVMCLGARRGEEVMAALELGATEAIGIDLVPFPPQVVEGDFHNLPVEDGTWETVFCNSVDHVKCPETFGKEALRVLKPGGHVVLHLVCGAWSDEMSLGLDKPEQLAPYFPGATVVLNTPHKLQSGATHILVLQK